VTLGKLNWNHKIHLHFVWLADISFFRVERGMNPQPIMSESVKIQLHTDINMYVYIYTTFFLVL
jgi:hypothetical protein